VAAILILDTCAVLDLIRAPVRTEFNVSYAARARALLAAARQAQPIVHLIVSDVVRIEYARNLPIVWEDALAQFRKRGRDYRHALDVVSGYTDTPATHCVDDQWIDANLKHGQQLAGDFMTTAATEVATDDDHVRATRRVYSRTAPAAVGNNNLADCVITEIALRIAAARHTGAPGAPKVAFLSSNTAEFCDVTHLKPSLQIEFDAVELKYARNWGEAWAATLRSAGQ
jgi:hypothetical protein